ncbi:MAG: bifunctional pyr operon transcriptional regulator/uracil phosphoribosyltransferase PyrR [Acidobacteriota bacterium]|jgi:pyrimidine operon attenuation protein/uracil phosphoribosyltransferase
MKKIKGKLLMKAEEIDLALARISAEIVEKLGSDEEFALVGIRSRGVHLAERLRDKIGGILKRSIPFGILDITLYRDDFTAVSNHPILRETLINFDINNLSLVLVDDVLYTGRTIRAALDGITDLGRPRKIQLAVLVDRGERELPIQADYVGKRIEIAEDETIEVRLEEMDREERVVLINKS